MGKMAPTTSQSIKTFYISAAFFWKKWRRQPSGSIRKTLFFIPLIPYQHIDNIRFYQEWRAAGKKMEDALGHAFYHLACLLLHRSQLHIFLLLLLELHLYLLRLDRRFDETAIGTAHLLCSAKSEKTIGKGIYCT
jgi:hypothetical protein